MRKRSNDLLSVHPEAASVASQPPPGPLTVHHGPPSRPVTLYGTRRLRHMLALSETCDVEQLADDAATEIETLRNERKQHGR